MTDTHPNKTEDPGPRSRLVTIYVNTRPHQVEKDEISYEEVVQLAYPTPPPGQNVGYTVLYQRAHGNKNGALGPGQSIKVKDEISFDVTPTDLS